MALRYHPGKMVEAYWPDDDEWLAATVTHVKESGTIGITWSSDGSMSTLQPPYTFLNKLLFQKMHPCSLRAPF